MALEIAAWWYCWKRIDSTSHRFGICRPRHQGSSCSSCSTGTRKEIGIASSYVKIRVCGITVALAEFPGFQAEKIYGFVKSNTVGTVFATTSKKLMVEKDLYTLLGKSGMKRQTAEELFAGHRGQRKRCRRQDHIGGPKRRVAPSHAREATNLPSCLTTRTWVRTPDITAKKDAALGLFDNNAFLEWYGHLVPARSEKPLTPVPKIAYIALFLLVSVITVRINR